MGVLRRSRESGWNCHTGFNSGWALDFTEATSKAFGTADGTGAEGPVSLSRTIRSAPASCSWLPRSTMAWAAGSTLRRSTRWAVRMAICNFWRASGVSA